MSHPVEAVEYAGLQVYTRSMVKPGVGDGEPYLYITPL